MDHVPDPAVLLAWAANVVLLTVAAVAAGELLVRLRSGAGPRWSQQVRRAVLLVCLTAPVAVLLPAAPQWGLLAPVSPRGTAAPDAAALQDPAAPPGSTSATLSFTLEAGIDGEVVVYAVPAGRTTESARFLPAGRVVPQAVAAPSPWLVAAAWVLPAFAVGGLLVGGTRLLLQARRLAKLRRQAAPVPEADLPPGVVRSATEIGLARLPAVLRCEATGSPAAFGVLRPTVLLPASCLAVGPTGPTGREDALRAVLLHEFAHHAGRDPLWNWVAALACSACWWNPLVARLAARLRTDNEFLADETAARCLGDGVKLAGYLAGVAEDLSRRGRSAGIDLLDEDDDESADDAVPGPALGMAEFRSELGRRVERLLALEPSTVAAVPLSRGVAMLTTAAGLGAALLFPQIGVRAAVPLQPSPVVTVVPAPSGGSATASSSSVTEGGAAADGSTVVTSEVATGVELRRSEGGRLFTRVAPGSPAGDGAGGLSTEVPSVGNGGRGAPAGKPADAGFVPGSPLALRLMPFEERTAPGGVAGARARVFPDGEVGTMRWRLLPEDHLVFFGDAAVGRIVRAVHVRHAGAETSARAVAGGAGDAELRVGFDADLRVVVLRGSEDRVAQAVARIQAMDLAAAAQPRALAEAVAGTVAQLKSRLGVDEVTHLVREAVAGGGVGRIRVTVRTVTEGKPPSAVTLTTVQIEGDPDAVARMRAVLADAEPGRP